jgi:ribokinase
MYNLTRLLAARRLLVVGGLNVDQILRAESEPADDGSARVSEYGTGFGGHAGNCACALACLGVGTAVLGSVGDDADGAALVADLEACGVDTDYVRRVPGVPTGHVVIPCFPGRRYMLMHRGANDVWPVPADKLEEAVEGFDAVLLFDPPADFADALFNVLKGGGRKVYWNPGGLLAGLPWTRSRLACADVVLMNREETRSAFGGAVNGRLAAELRAERAGFRLVETLGREGARLHAGGKTLRAASFPARVVDETGAGDAFTAAFAAFDGVGFDARTAMRLANAVGACAIEELGARAGLPRLPALAERWDLTAELSPFAAPPETVGAGGARPVHGR